VIWPVRIAWGVLAAATLAAAAAAYFLQLPEPAGGIAIDRAIYLAHDGAATTIALPHKSELREAELPGAVHYRVHFDLAAKPQQALFLYVPAVNRRVTIALNGETFFDTGVRTFLSGPIVSATIFVNMPHALLLDGRNEVMLTFETGHVALSRHLSRIFVGSEAQLLPNVRLRGFLQERLITMALGAQILLGLSILFIYFLRPRDPLFFWLAALVVLTTIVSIGLFIEFRRGLEDVRAFAVALSTGVGMLFIAIALAIVGISPPRILRIATVVIPALLVLCIVSGTIESRTVLVMICFPIFFVMLVAGTAVVAWGALWRGNTEARLMLAPFFLISWFGVRDILLGVGILDGSVLISPYVRPLFLAATMAVLMRRFAISLHHLDHANENLNRKLAEREEQLANLYRQERVEAARTVREKERQRLTRDLHDGISGHLVSIIAMAERGDDHGRTIEQAARHALDDLRLVIYSLDIGDRELPLALANFRERLIPQLQRIGVALDWSTGGLPEVSGVTPGNALAILRILQEAITNALKHGPARRIAVRGRAMPSAQAASAQAAIVVENDGAPFAAEQAGLGLENMRRRAHQLQGDIEIAALPAGTQLTLLLPATLPDLEDEPAD
jgi:signal transduction histidine kinase